MTTLTKSEAYRLRGIIETSVAATVDDQTASTAATLFPSYKTDGSLLKAQSRINWKGTVMRATVDLWQTPENDPDHAHTLWEPIQYVDGIRVIPETITASAAFAKGEKGWWHGVLYESLIDANVWTPEQHEAGWKLVAE